MNTILAKTLFFLFGLTGLAYAQETPRSFCIVEPHDQLCPVFPEDQPDFSRFFEYRVVNAPAQAPFDEYAWQAFVALNWDAVRPGSNLHGWRDYARGTEVMRTADPACQASSPETVVADIRQSDGNTLVDQAGNFIVYEKRMNAVALTYILENELNIPAQRAKFDQKINFPLGVDQDQPASVLIKTAWRILDGPEAGYVEADGLIPIPKQHALENRTACLTVRLGLVGMHIVAKVQSGNGDKWIWATFEHVDNVPTAQNARDINSLYAKSLFPDGCLPPETQSISDYLLFDATCPDCPTNEAPTATLLWSETPPFARRLDGTPAQPSQVVRCWDIFGPTQDTNTVWQAKLNGSKLANYMLISSQWRGANPDPIFEHGELPRYLSNTTMETYLQTDPSGTCLGCHAAAETSEGAFSDFTFLLRN